MEAEKKQRALKHYSILSDIWFFVRFYKREEPLVLFFCGAEIILGACIPLLTIYLPKLAIDLVEQRADTGRVVIILGGYSLLMMTALGLKNGIQAGKYNLYNIQRTNILGIFFLKSLRLKYSDQEAGELKKLYWKACNTVQGGDWSASSQMVNGTVDLCINLLSFLLYSTVLAYLSVSMFLILSVLAFINYGISMCHIRYEESLRDERAAAQKHFYCVQNTMGNVYGAKDIRIYGMKSWMLALRNQAIGELRSLAQKSKRRDDFYEKVGLVLAAVRNLGAYAYLLYQTAAGSVSVGEFVLYFGAVTGFSGFINSIMGSFAALRRAANDTDYIRQYLKLPEENRKSGKRHIDQFSFPIEITFRHVDFSYKGSDGEEDRTIFRDLNLTIHKGEKLALVGVNGAGKTTLVKLLCGMYEPDAGQILINGIDRNEFPRKELYRLFSAIFQETIIFPFTVLENLAMDRIERADGKKAWEALEQAGLKHTFLEKGIGLHSYMTKIMMEDGVELSGGQKQRFLLARALYKDAPVMILDEPTAALDPIAESEIYEHYSQYSQGKTAIFISHRLASTRFSDRVVLLENGKIIEDGTHDELMAAGGKYAEMFEIQSSYYQQEESWRQII